METKITSKFQTTIPRKVRQLLGIKAGKEIDWHVIKGMIVVEKDRKVKNPTKFLTSQIKIDIDAVKLIREVRGEMI